MKRNVLVTGGAGFLGSYVVGRLSDFHTIVPRSSSEDLRDKHKCEQIFYREQPDAVIHLAATCGGIGANRQNPGKYFYDNMLMGINIIECCNNFNIGKLVIVGTVCSYPKYCPVPFKEEDIWNGYPEETNAPYGIAKKSLYIMAKAYQEQYGLNSTVLIPSNLYGPRDNFKDESSHVIPALIKKIYKAKAGNLPNVEIWGDGTPTREFLYADDAARAIVSSLDYHTDAEPINIGTGQEISIRELAHKIKNIIQYEGDILFNPEYPNGQPRRCVDTTRAEKLLNFKALISLDSGLENTIDWYINRNGV
jgi:GDP-L-fucose synthase